MCLNNLAYRIQLGREVIKNKSKRKEKPNEQYLKWLKMMIITVKMNSNLKLLDDFFFYYW